MSDSETECSTESDEMDSDSGYGIGRRRTSCQCAARRRSPPVTERRQLPVYLDDCASFPLSATEGLVLVPRQWPPSSTSATCSRQEVSTDTSQRVACTSTATTSIQHHHDRHTVNVGVNTVVTGCQHTAQTAHHGVSIIIIIIIIILRLLTFLYRLSLKLLVRGMLRPLS